MEDINSEFDKICIKIGIQTKLPHKNKSNHNDYKKYYNNRTRDLIKKYFKEDIELFKYEF